MVENSTNGNKTKVQYNVVSGCLSCYLIIPVVVKCGSVKQDYFYREFLVASRSSRSDASSIDLAFSKQESQFLLC